MLLRSLPNHHAVLLVHSKRQAVGDSLWSELGNVQSAHIYINQAVLDIDTARNLITWANTPYHEEKFAIVSFHTATLPAQNALLKVLEEPPQGIRFVIITPNREHLLATIVSRTVLVTSVDTTRDTSQAESFLGTKPVLRMKLPEITKLLSQEDEEGRKDREQIRSFILDVVDVLALQKNIPQKYCKETLEMASYVGDPSIAVKPVIEYLSLLLPKCDTI
jgi:hypothetical protein